MKVKVTGEIILFPLFTQSWFLLCPGTALHWSANELCFITVHPEASIALVPGQTLCIILTDIYHWNAEESDWPGVRTWGKEVWDEADNVKGLCWNIDHWCCEDVLQSFGLETLGQLIRQTNDQMLDWQEG